jgi:hypothetical protein
MSRLKLFQDYFNCTCCSWKRLLGKRSSIMMYCIRIFCLKWYAQCPRRLAFVKIQVQLRWKCIYWFQRRRFFCSRSAKIFLIVTEATLIITRSLQLSTNSGTLFISCQVLLLSSKRTSLLINLLGDYLCERNLKLYYRNRLTIGVFWYSFIVCDTICVSDRN